MRVPRALLLVLTSPALAVGAEPGAAKTPSPVPSALTAPRDPASGLPTGKRTHMPIRARVYYDRALKLGDGRVFLVNTKTGEVEFGDGTKGDTPPTGHRPGDGTYFLDDGTPCRIQAGKLVKKPTATPKSPGAAGNVPH